MTNRILIHLLLAAVLCISQLAASVHLVGHFHDHGATKATAESSHYAARMPFAAALAEQQKLAHPSNADHDDAHTDKGTVDTECAIFHAYLGNHACVPGVLQKFVVPAVEISILPTQGRQITAHTVLSQFIRGPPVAS